MAAVAIWLSCGVGSENRFMHIKLPFYQGCYNTKCTSQVVPWSEKSWKKEAIEHRENGTRCWPFDINQWAMAEHFLSKPCSQPLQLPKETLIIKNTIKTKEFHDLHVTTKRKGGKKDLTKQEGDKTKHAAVFGFQASCRFLKDLFYLSNSSKIQ